MENFTRGFVRCACLSLAWIVAAPGLAQSLPSHPEAENSGQDPTRPVSRLDVRLKYQDNPNGFEAQFLTLRADKPYMIGGGWKLTTEAAWRDDRSESSKAR